MDSIAPWRFCTFALLSDSKYRLNLPALWHNLGYRSLQGEIASPSGSQFSVNIFLTNQTYAHRQMRSTGAAGGLEHGMWNWRDVTEHLFSRASDDDLGRAQNVQIGGYVRGHASTQVALRNSMPCASVLRWRSLRSPNSTRSHSQGVGLVGDPGPCRRQLRAFWRWLADSGAIRRPFVVLVTLCATIGAPSTSLTAGPG